MAVFDKWFEQDLHEELITQHCEAIVLTGDNLSNLIGVRLYEDGEPAAPAGVVTLRAIRADGTTVVDNDGVLSGNAASIVLKESCMAVPGPLVLQLRVTNGDVRTTVLRAVFTVDISETGVIIDPGRVIPDVETLLAMLAEMEDAKDAANQAAEDAETAAAAADTAASGANAAANAANTAAASVDAAKAAAQAAATAANAAATAANTATTEANAARDYAYDAGEGAGAAARDAYSASAEAYAATDGANAAANAANTAASTANTAAENADEATDDANQAVDDLRHFMEQVTPADTATGRVVTFEPTTEGPFIGLEVFGRCEQDDIPTPTSPKDIAVAGDGGTLKMNTASKNLAYMERGTLDASGAEVASTTAWRTGYLPIMGACVYASKDYNFSDSTLNMTAHFYGANMAYLGSAVVMDYNVLQQATVLSTVAAAAGAIFVRFVQDFPSTSSRPEMFSVMVTFGASGEQFPEFSLADGSRATLLIPSGAGLCGLPVEETDSWNYQDTEGQYWACDVASYSDGVCTRRVGKTTFANLTGLQYDASTGIFKTTSPIPTGQFENHIMTRIYETVDNDYYPPALQDGQICPIYTGAAVQWKDSRFTSVEDMLAAIGNEPIYYMLRTSSVTYMSDEQKRSFNALRSCDGTTHVFAEDAARPYFTASVYSNFLEYLDERVDDAVQVAVSEAVEPIRDEVDNIGERVDDLEAYVRDMSPVATVGPADMVSIDDAAPLTVEGLTVNVEPAQDLHGYDHPWPAGGGKNLLQLTVDAIKSANTSGGTWSGNAYTTNGVTYTINTDESGNVIGITANGTASENSFLYLTNGYTFPDGSYVLNGCPSAGNVTTYCQYVYANTAYFDAGTGATFQITSQTANVLIRVMSGTAVSNVVFNPMIRLASETDATFAPYSNICPITGWDGVTVTDEGKNLLEVTATTQTVNDVTYTVNDDGTIRISGTPTANYGSYAISYVTLPAGDYKVNGFDVGSQQGNRLVLTNNLTGVELARVFNGADVSFSLSEETTIKVFPVILVSNGAINTVVKPMIRYASDTNATFTPYVPPRTASVDFDTTVYGGTVDLATGECVVDSGYIASYAGETLPGEWISSMDVYTPGGTPTTGAQVVYKLANLIPLTLTPTELELFKGTNNISADAGQVTVTYRQDVFLALNKRINELQALVLES